MFQLSRRLANKMYADEVEIYRKDFLNSFQGQSILITGASGLIGLPIVDILMHLGNVEVFGLCRNETYAEQVFSPYKRDEKFHLLIGNVDEFNFSAYHFNYIIHAASAADPRSIATDPVGVMKANIGGIDNLLDYGKNHSCRILYVSSGEIYGQDILHHGRFTEDDCGYIDTKKPRSSYPESKRAAETYCVSYKEEYGVNVVVARQCHVYGPTIKETDTRVLAEFILDAVNGTPIVLKSEGTQQRSLCYVFDAADAFLFLLQKANSGDFYNITGGEDSVKRIRDMALIIGKIGKIDTEAKPVQMDDFNKYAGFDHAHLDSHKLFELGWRPKRTFEEGVAKTIAIMSEG